MELESRQYVVPEAFYVGVSGPGTALWAHPSSAIGERLAEAEAEAFPEAPELFDGSDEYLMLGVVAHGRVVHVMRLSVPLLVAGLDAPFIIREVVGSGQAVSYDEVVMYYRERSIDLRFTLSVESNVALRGPDELEMRSADMAYLSVFRLLRAFEGSAVFAHLNNPATRSFERFGIPFEPLAGRSDLHTPSSTPGVYDEHYRPYCITYAEAGPTFEALRSLIPPSMWCTPAPVWWPASENVELEIDLRSSAGEPLVQPGQERSSGFAGA